MLYRIFICHSYNHSDIYSDLVKKLNNAPWFKWHNQSVQYDMRFGVTDDLDDDQLRGEIDRKITECNVFLALTKPVAIRRRWLQWEIRRAHELGKPIIGIARNRNDNVSKFVKSHACDIVDTWRTDHIVNAIKLYRKEMAGRAVILPAPTTLPPEQEDVEVEAEPSPDLPSVLPAFPQARETVREVLSRTLGDVRPADFSVHPVQQQKMPRWWWPFARDGRQESD